MRHDAADQRAVGDVDRRRAELGLDEGHDAIGTQYATHPGQDPLDIVEVDQQALGAHVIERMVGVGKAGCIADPVVDRKSLCGRTAPRFGDEGLAPVDAAHGSALPGAARERDCLQPEAAADIQDRAAGTDHFPFEAFQFLQLVDPVEGLQGRDIGCRLSRFVDGGEGV